MKKEFLEKLSLRDVQLSSLEILKYVDEICTKCGFDYFIMYGTLIGAVRHKGFIPWDDDIDIMMPREDYLNFLNYLESNKNDIMPLELFSYNKNNEYPYMISRVSDSRYILDVDNEINYGIGTFIDIYPLDYISHSYTLAKIKGRYFGFLSSLYFLATRMAPPKSNSYFKFFIKKILFLFAKVIGKCRLKKLLSVKNNTSLKDEDCFLGCLQWMTNDYKRNIFKSSLLKGRVRLEFEGLSVVAPLNYDEILTNYYGDYMELPPKADRIPHHCYQAYRK